MWHSFNLLWEGRGGTWTTSFLNWTTLCPPIYLVHCINCWGGGKRFHPVHIRSQVSCLATHTHGNEEAELRPYVILRLVV